MGPAFVGFLLSAFPSSSTRSASIRIASRTSRTDYTVDFLSHKKKNPVVSFDSAGRALNYCHGRICLGDYGSFNCMISYPSFGCINLSCRFILRQYCGMIYSAR
ncbi:hypothetical protein VTN49DRAFT_4958 [Thermomyces lanuginosus]|uniref:uncharacterized protein n=1 Tax=Thermomyces lanuginosus TaxID=5541 RepID=UPI00374268F5